MQFLMFITLVACLFIRCDTYWLLTWPTQTLIGPHMYYSLIISHGCSRFYVIKDGLYRKHICIVIAPDAQGLPSS